MTICPKTPEQDERDKWEVQVYFWASVLIIVLAALFMHLVTAEAAWDRVAQEWEPYRLNEQQRQWFKSVHPKGPGPSCCDIADGHPTQQDHRADGYYIPNPKHPDHDWVRVPESAMTTPGSNPVGVATVWFGRGEDADGNPYIRCFVPEAET